ncbi:hypothetical protein Ahy_A03g012948 [Arachis hypogaea]|uniref:Uncharacterized protein n=1 Tax=Arachis hypogaea TaxID=3818 RepID=A0A445DUJ6_ARAHY|nr:hypothetical protein Ahy_A03g012948 [Arachis hypogaea]
MIINSSPFMNSVLVLQNLCVFGPGLNPFDPYCVAHNFH